MCSLKDFSFCINTYLLMKWTFFSLDVLSDIKHFIFLFRLWNNVLNCIPSSKNTVVYCIRQYFMTGKYCITHYCITWKCFIIMYCMTGKWGIIQCLVTRKYLIIWYFLSSNYCMSWPWNTVLYCIFLTGKYCILLFFYIFIFFLPEIRYCTLLYNLEMLYYSVLFVRKIGH